VGNVSRNNRHYGGILVLVKTSAIEGYRRINSRSENLLGPYIRFKYGKQFILGGLNLSSYNRENTWEIL